MMMLSSTAPSLDDIGFYTLHDERAHIASSSSRLSRCELVLSGRCNFRCPYCRSVGGRDVDFGQATEIIRRWADQQLFAIRFSGGEPTLYERLPELVALAQTEGVERTAVSTNGSADWSIYSQLCDAGVNDWSVSLDACCAKGGDKMAGGVPGAWERAVETIERLSLQSYTTVGIVLRSENIVEINDIIRFAASLGVADIRVIPAVQEDDSLSNIDVDVGLLERFPILAYRVRNLRAGLSVRGLSSTNSQQCALVLDDMAVNQGRHYPCIIYMREGGDAIGRMSDEVRSQRLRWFEEHNCHDDPICSTNCLDVCRDYNDRWRANHLEE